MNARKKSIVTFTMIGSIITAGFGIWHFFIPGIWDWYSYISPEATELVIAVRAINIFFSLLLVLTAVGNVMCTLKYPEGRFQTIVIISISVILWATRVVLQLVYPQGSQNEMLRYGMLFTFIVVFACYLISLVLLTSKENSQAD